MIMIEKVIRIDQGLIFFAGSDPAFPVKTDRQTIHPQEIIARLAAGRYNAGGITCTDIRCIS